jgi:hypothetical protein
MNTECWGSDYCTNIVPLLEVPSIKFVVLCCFLVCAALWLILFFQVYSYNY